KEPVAPEPKPAPVQRKTYRQKRENAQVYAIKDLQDGMSRIAIEGHIFSVENRILKTDRMLQILYISDYESAISAKRFETKRVTRQEMEEIKKGATVRMVGNVVYDSFSKGLSFQIERLEPIEAKHRTDTQEEKRVEWHLHSNFSEMDGVSAIDQYIQTAFDWGMDAIGVCDHDVVQAFPFAQHKIESLLHSNPQREFKMLYGCEMDMIDTECKTVLNNDHRSLHDATFVVFDLETTGLSNRLDAIIEFGAVKMKNREVIGRKQMFIDPQREIPADIVNLTHITQKDVQGAKTIDEALDELLEFISDSVLVAHNGSFDIGFMNAACRNAGKEELTNPLIDTLPLAQMMMDTKSYRLGSLCRHYNVAYDGEGAHRADYDAEVLSSCLCHMLNAFDAHATLDDLMKYDLHDHMHKLHANHVCVYAKNKAGLKELFRLVTAAHTEYLAYKKPAGNNTMAFPRIPKHVLEEYHQHGNLLFGSACQNGEIFDLAQTRSENDLGKAMEFYDYIEVQPLSCYKNLLDRNAIHSLDDLKTILGFILDKAQE
ncbi:MAG: PHP domain-containing protein, partial [Erysipelotrichaceae bacterium]|nr:PHP domain-containing protein [Erysipelotrichaceae bacterium]